MSRSVVLVWLLAAAVCLVAGCATSTTKPLDRALAAQEAREATLALHGAWELRGRIAVHSIRQHGSGSVTWRHAPDALQFDLSAPVTRQGWSLIANGDGAMLRGLEEGDLQGESAEALLRNAFDWEVPIEPLGFWVRGARAPGQAKVLLGADGLPKQIEQGGWKIEYREWVAVDGLTLPRRVFAEQGPNRVRLVIDQWQLAAQR